MKDSFAMNRSSFVAAPPPHKAQKPNPVDLILRNPTVYTGVIRADMRTLGQHIARGQFTGPHAEREIKRATLQILSGARHLHKHTISHQNICAANIVALDAEGLKYALCGFEHATEETHVSVSEAGTRAYMAPECWRRRDGVTGRTYDPRVAEIWALGVMLVQMITGALPWDVAAASDTRFVSACTWGIPALEGMRIKRKGKKLALMSLLFAIDPAERVTLDELCESVQKAKTLQRDSMTVADLQGNAELLKIKIAEGAKRQRLIEGRFDAARTVALAIAQPEQYAKEIERLRQQAKLAQNGMI